MHRDVEPGPRSRQSGIRGGRSVIAVIGIDEYVAWPRLGNAVSDAVATSRLFHQLGFVEVTPPLLEHAATCEAMHRLVTDDLADLSPDDSLVLFFAGHGHTHTAHFGDVSVRTGCVIPVDGAPARSHVSASWLRLDSWLSDIARLPPRHILVIVDACHSGVALSSIARWRHEGSWPILPPDALQARRSRRIITSALDDQRALDTGPMPDHSLFTGCLLEGLSGGLAEGGRRLTTGRQLGQYLQDRVRSYPQSTQTPDFGAFELDDRGDLAIPILPLLGEATAVSPPGTSPRDTLEEPVPGLSVLWGLPRIPPITLRGLGYALSRRMPEPLALPPDPPAVARSSVASARSSRLPGPTAPGIGPPPPPPRTTPVVTITLACPVAPPRDLRSCGTLWPAIAVVAGMSVIAGLIAVGITQPPDVIGFPSGPSSLVAASGLDASSGSDALNCPTPVDVDPGATVPRDASSTAASKIEVEVQSRPPGAEIYIDEVDTHERTPATLEMFAKSGKTFSITLQLEGYHPYTFDAIEQETSSVHSAKLVRLKSAQARMRCEAPDHAGCSRDRNGCCVPNDPDGLIRP